MATCSSADSVLEAASLIKSNSTKLNTFVNGTATETVQLGTGNPTPTLRNMAANAVSIVAAAMEETIVDSVEENQAAIATLQSGKADKVSNTTNGHLAGLNASGNLTDSGIASSNVATKNGDISTLNSNKADKVSGAAADNFAGLNASGNLTDSGYSATTVIEPCLRGFPTSVTAENYEELGITDLDNLTDNRIYLIREAIDGIANQPLAGGYIVFSVSPFSAGTAVSGQAQFAITGNGTVYKRLLWGYPPTWTAWTQLAAEADLAYCLKGAGKIPSAEAAEAAGISSINDMPANSVYTFSYYIESIANQPFDTSYTVLTMSPANEVTGGTFQIAISNSGVTKWRIGWGNPISTWTSWSQAATETELTYCLKGAGKLTSAEETVAAGITDIDTLHPNSVYTFSYYDESIANQPFNTAYTVLTMSPTRWVTGGTFQIAISHDGIMKKRIAWQYPTVWGEWEETAGTESAGRILAAGNCTAAEAIASNSVGGHVNYSTGAYSTYGEGTYRATGFIPVVQGETFEAKRCADVSSANSSGVAFYDSQKVFISGVQYQAKDSTGFSPAISVAVPKGACFVRLTITENCVEHCSFRSYGSAGLDTANSLAFRIATEIPMLRNVTNGLIECFLTMGCIGDSIMAGSCYYDSSHGIRYPQHSWPGYLAKMTGNTYYNWAIGGIRTDTWLESDAATECYDGQHLCTGYIIGLGINDYNYMSNNHLDFDTFIGTVADIDTEDYNNNADTFCGRYGKIIQKIQEIQPKAKIFVCTPHRTQMETSGINTAIRSMPTVFQNVYLIDINTYFDKAYNGGIINQMLRAGHFNAVGYHEMATIIASYIDWIIRTNPTEFREIEFIGTNYSYYD